MFKNLAFSVLVGFSAITNAVNEETSQDLIRAVKYVSNKDGLVLCAACCCPIIFPLISLYGSEESEKDLRKLTKLLENGADINYQEKASGYTALTYAAYYGYPGIARLLLRNGADPSIMDKKGYNALKLRSL